MRALGQNPTNAEVLKVLGNPKSDGEGPQEQLLGVGVGPVLWLSASFVSVGPKLKQVLSLLANPTDFFCFEWEQSVWL